MADIICIDDNFPQNVLEFYKENGVTTPVKDKLYTVRNVTKHIIGKTGILLNEIVNPKVPINDSVMGLKHIEPTWNINRFTTLSGLPLKKEEIEVENFV